MRVVIVGAGHAGIEAALASGAHLMTVETIHDVTYSNTMAHLDKLVAGDGPC